MAIPTIQDALDAFGKYRQTNDQASILNLDTEVGFQIYGMFPAPRQRKSTPEGEGVTDCNIRALHPTEFLTKHYWQSMLQIHDYFDQYKWEYFDVFDDLYAQHTELGSVKDDVENIHEKSEDAERRERLSEITAEVESVDHLFMDIGLFDWHSHPKTYRLMKSIELISSHVVLQYKDRYKRRRPTFDHPHLNSIIDVPSHSSWPSGHSIEAHSIATMLTSIIQPFSESRRTKLENTANRIAENREWAGVHYRSDSEAGAILSNFIMHDIGEKYKQGIDSRLNTLIAQAEAEWE